MYFNKTFHQKIIKCLLIFTIIISFADSAFSQTHNQIWDYTISIQPESQIVKVELKLTGNKSSALLFKMPTWTPGYYQFMNYARNLSGFSAMDENGKALNWLHTDANSWRVNTVPNKIILIRYTIKATRNFVAGNFVDASHAFLSPAGIFLYKVGNITQPINITIKQLAGWKGIATGLDKLNTTENIYTAKNFDVLYDSPILMGELESLPEFKIKGIPHYFIGYKIGDFNRVAFINNLKKIVIVGTRIFGEVPYTHYTFLGIGPGRGGIEHLNSAAVSFDGNDLNDTAGQLKMYSFLAHEYFHNFNVKRIRPIELGPFDYQMGNVTQMLWVSEGFTVYYEYLLIHRAGITTPGQLLNSLRENLLAYETRPGHFFQSATGSSLETWSDGPFGRTGDEVNKTISYYDKGPVLGLMLDMKIRHETNNTKSLDDVMRQLYFSYYKKLKRGFTPPEFQQVCEQVAGVPLKELFEYAATTKPVNYHKYFAYAGLSIDDTLKTQPGLWSGITAAIKNDSLQVTDVEWNSPAWNCGIRTNTYINAINGQPANIERLAGLTATNTGDITTMDILKNGQTKQVKFKLIKHQSCSFKITPVSHPNILQKAIYKSIFN